MEGDGQMLFSLNGHGGPGGRGAGIAGAVPGGKRKWAAATAAVLALALVLSMFAGVFSAMASTTKYVDDIAKVPEDCGAYITKDIEQASWELTISDTEHFEQHNNWVAYKGLDASFSGTKNIGSAGSTLFSIRYKDVGYTVDHRAFDILLSVSQVTIQPAYGQSAITRQYHRDPPPVTVPVDETKRIYGFNFFYPPKATAHATQTGEGGVTVDIGIHASITLKAVYAGTSQSIGKEVLYSFMDLDAPDNRITSSARQHIDNGYTEEVAIVSGSTGKEYVLKSSVLNKYNNKDGNVTYRGTVATTNTDGVGSGDYTQDFSTVVVPAKEGTLSVVWSGSGGAGTKIAAGAGSSVYDLKEPTKTPAAQTITTKEKAKFELGAHLNWAPADNGPNAIEIVDTLQPAGEDGARYMCYDLSKAEVTIKRTYTDTNGQNQKTDDVTSKWDIEKAGRKITLTRDNYENLDDIWGDYAVTIEVPYKEDCDFDKLERDGKKMVSYNTVKLSVSGNGVKGSATGPTVKVYTDALGTIKVAKASAQSWTEGMDGYSLKGAEYGIFTNSACTDEAKVGTVTTGTDGNSEEFSTGEGTYYIKELKPSPGYGLDEEVKKVKLKIDDAATVASYEPPMATNLRIKKRDAAFKDSEELVDTPQGSASFQGAQYRVDYYNKVYAKIADLPTKPTRSWVIQSDSDGLAKVDNAHLVSGDALYTGANGKPTIPLGSITVTEVAAPASYTLFDQGLTVPKTYLAQVNAKDDGTVVFKAINDTAYNLAADGTMYAYDVVARGSADLTKSDWDLREIYERAEAAYGKDIDLVYDENRPQGNAVFTGAVFALYNANSNPVIKPTDGKTVVKPGEEVCRIKTDSKGYASTDKGTVNGWTRPTTWKGELAYGTYRLKEVTAPQGYGLNEGWVGVVTVSKDGVRVAVEEETRR